ncbi:MAG: hypothetical protein IT427_12680, partial [Pirellulales bacterium]|nr:hypothetical protein [Pirellulales bacterium]
MAGAHVRAISYLLSVLCVLVAHSLGNPPRCFGDSVWNSGTSGSWLDPAKWNGPIPINAGDAADLTWSPKKSLLVELPSLVTLGSLDFSSPSTFVVYGAGSLQFDQPGSNAALLQALGLPRLHRITVPVGIADVEGLMVNVSPSSVLSLEGGISSASGNLIKLGNGKLEMDGDNSAWTGDVNIQAGEIFVKNNHALGSVAVGTQVNSGAVLTLDRGLALDEPLQFSGGMLLRGGTVAGSTTVAGTIELLSTSTISSPTATNTLNLQGQISGPGGLRVISTQSTSNGVFISGDNTYEGPTAINTGRVTVQSATALGSILEGTTVNPGAELIITKTTADPIEINGGRVNLRTAVTSTGPVSIKSGELSLPESGQYSSTIALTSARSLSAYLQLAWKITCGCASLAVCHVAFSFGVGGVVRNGSQV